MENDKINGLNAQELENVKLLNDLDHPNIDLMRDYSKQLNGEIDDPSEQK